MNGQKTKNSIINAIKSDGRTVFRLEDIAFISGETDFNSINFRLNYAVRTGKLLNPRKGIYTKLKFNFEELASILYTPAYISLEYVLAQEGIISDYCGEITLAGYVSRSITIEDKRFIIRKLKGEILASTAGITIRRGATIASKERAFLDMLYLAPDFSFDNLATLNIKKIALLLPIYNSSTLNKKVSKLLGEPSLAKVMGTSRELLKNKYLMLQILKYISNDLKLFDLLFVRKNSVKLLFGESEKGSGTLELKLTESTNKCGMHQLLESVLSGMIIDEAMTREGPIYVIKQKDGGTLLNLKIFETETYAEDKSLQGESKTYAGDRTLQSENVVSDGANIENASFAKANEVLYTIKYFLGVPIKIEL